MKYRENPHNKTLNNHCKLNEKQVEVLLSLFENKNHRQFVMLYYGEGYTCEKCAELMFYSKRNIERIKKEVDKIAFYSLLNIVINSENALKLSKIKNIIMGGN
jgi:hypothetical protein